MSQLTKTDGSKSIVQTLLAELRPKSNDELLEMVRQCSDGIGVLLMKMAVAVSILRERDVDLSHISAELLDSLERLASETLEPGVVLNYSGTRAFSYIAALPKVEQKKICESGSVPLAVVEDGQPTHHLYPVLAMEKEELDQAFANGRLRTIPEQIQLLKKKGKPKEYHTRIWVDEINVCIWIGQVRLGLDQLEHYAKLLKKAKKNGTFKAA